MKKLFFLVLFASQSLFATDQSSTEKSVVCSAFCQAVFKRTVESSLNAYTANQTYFLKTTTMNREIEFTTSNDRLAAIENAKLTCRKYIEEQVEGYNKEILSLKIFTDSSVKTELNSSNLNCRSMNIL